MDDAHPYSPRRLRGTARREGLLWRWGRYRDDGDPGRPARSERDDPSLLGIRPVLGKTYGSRPPLELELCDITAAYDHALSDFQRQVVTYYYVHGYGLRHNTRRHRTTAERLITAPRDEDEIDRQELMIDRFGVEDIYGDRAIAYALHTNHERVARARRRAVYRIARFLGWRPPQPKTTPEDPDSGDNGALQ